MDGLFSSVDYLAWKDVIDIIVVAILIYQFMSIVKGTRAFQVLMGLLFVSGFYWLGVSYQLNALNWLLANFFQSFFIIIIILFQEQIKGALAKMAQKGKFFEGRKGVKEDVIAEVVDSCFKLSAKKIGALIVLERNDGLGNFIESGTPLNSEIHSDFIYAIFQSNGALHDGAVIYSNNRLAAAGCYLPLSKDVDVDRNLGTRHRAAVGMTEVTDAVVLVVSEESSEVKLCFEGKFYLCPNARVLAQYLRVFWMEQDDSLLAIQGGKV